MPFIFHACSQFQIKRKTFHAKGHTKCAPAAFLSTYANVDPCLPHISSSAAECGNGGLNCIHKSVSYMSQDRVIIYTNESMMNSVSAKKSAMLRKWCILFIREFQRESV
jgi:hypothetical protein